MGFFDFLFWRGIKKYDNFTVNDVSEDGEVVREVKGLLGRSGITITDFSVADQEKTIASMEKLLGFMKSMDRYGKTQSPEIEIKKFERFIGLLKSGAVKTFNISYEIDTTYVTKQEKNDIRERWNNKQKEFGEKIIELQ